MGQLIQQGLQSLIPGSVIALGNTILFILEINFILLRLFIIYLYLPFLCARRESVWRISDVGAGGSFVSPASKTWQGSDTDCQHQSQAGFLWSGEPVARP